MQVNRKGGGLLEGSHQLLRCIRGEQSGHILDAQGVCAHVLDLLGNVLPVIQGVRVAQGIGKSDLDMSFFLVGGLYSGLQIADIVQAVENTDDIDTVGDGFLHEILHHVVCIVIVA